MNRELILAHSGGYITARTCSLWEQSCTGSNGAPEIPLPKKAPQKISLDFWSQKSVCVLDRVSRRNSRDMRFCLPNWTHGPTHGQARSYTRQNLPDPKGGGQLLRLCRKGHLPVAAGHTREAFLDEKDQE